MAREHMCEYITERRERKEACEGIIGLKSTSGLFPLLPLRNYERIVLRVAICMMICLVALMLVGCKDRNKSSAVARWDRIVEGQNNEQYFIDGNAIERVSDEIVRISVRYAPTKDHFLISIRELAKEFGSGGQDIGLEYTVSTWEFNCVRPEGRCLSLTHFRKGDKIAVYNYPDPAWTPLDKAASTKVLRDLVCAEVSK